MNDLEDLYLKVLRSIQRGGMCQDLEEARYQLRVKEGVQLTEKALMELVAEMEKAGLVKARLVMVTTKQGRAMLGDDNVEAGWAPG